MLEILLQRKTNPATEQTYLFIPPRNKTYEAINRMIQSAEYMSGFELWFGMTEGTIVIAARAKTQHMGLCI
ncbi:hypothetical protein P030_02690 [Anaplasma phagocytophilum str. CRT35]|nr:hypothetical protein P030_02690 [Anaplasma phagocytophilum str. CRT35]